MEETTFTADPMRLMLAAAVGIVILLVLIIIAIIVYVIIRYKRGEIGPGAVNTEAADDFDDDFDADGGTPDIGEKPLTYDGSPKDGTV